MAQPYVTSFRYDGSGNPSAIGYPSGMEVTYGFDFAGRPVTAIASSPAGSTTLVPSPTYLPFGPNVARPRDGRGEPERPF